MAPKPKLLHRLTHPIWWEDIIPGFLFALPKIVQRSPEFLIRTVPAVSGHVAF